MKITKLIEVLGGFKETCGDVEVSLGIDDGKTGVDKTVAGIAKIIGNEHWLVIIGVPDKEINKDGLVPDVPVLPAEAANHDGQ